MGFTLKLASAITARRHEHLGQDFRVNPTLPPFG
jgi:hypothetical protein